MAGFRSDKLICIVGAPRCGTTSLSTFLKDHPAIRFSSVKEPHFFAQFDLRELSDSALQAHVQAEYVNRYFPPEADDDRIFAEGSVTYLYAPERMEPLLRLWPDAKFIIAVRDPMALLPSLHQRLLYLGDEEELDFERAWQLVPERKQGRHIPRACIDPSVLRYDEIGRLGHYVERFVSIVGRERCVFVVFDDLVSNPQDVYRRLLHDLDLPYHGRQDFEPMRQSLGCRSLALQRFLKRPPIVTRSVLAGQKYRQRIIDLRRKESNDFFLQSVWKARSRLLRWNRKSSRPAQLSSALRFEIRDRFMTDVAHLSRLVGRDLSHWLGGIPPADHGPAYPFGVSGPGEVHQNIRTAETPRFAVRGE